MLHLLTPTEKVILKLISENKTSAEIAAMLFVSPNTIDNHRANINRKLNLGGEKIVHVDVVDEHTFSVNEIIHDKVFVFW